MRYLRVVLVLALVLAASVAFGEVKWQQLPAPPTGRSMMSEFDTCGPVTAQCADDFLCNDIDPIAAVEWWGVYLDGEPVPPDYFIIRFYDDVVGPPSHPGNLLYEAECWIYNEEWDEQYEQYHYYHELVLPFDQTPGSIYWFSVQAVVCWPPTWAWCECDPIYYWNDEAVIVSEYYGIPEWAPVSGGDPQLYLELAFVLHTMPGSPAEESSWGNIKALFK